MDAQHWEQSSRLFESLIDLPEAERDGYIEAHCAGDPDLAATLRRMLAADVAAESRGFLDPALAPPAATLWDESLPGTADYAPGSRQFGPYRLLRLIGEGGMGEVHLAERADGVFEQRVALKLLPHPTPGLMQRFRQERQILARLEHPNIARLLDGGLGEHGIPYFAMEFVDGEPVASYVKAHQLDVGRTLRLFLHVCDAVQYAHRNLVVHRDLKPSNILVTSEAMPKLLDFGIAKVLEDTGQPEATRTQARMFTLDYAAPEQIRGTAITTATDVYALGVVLYELLAGQRPYSLAARNTTLEQAILETSPQAPSAALASGDTTTTQRRRELRGDLDRIVLTTLAKEPERRYPSAEALAADIRNYLAGRPVAARGDAAMYRLRKFVRRNRIALTAATIVALALIAATGASLWQARRANAQAARALAVKQFLASVFQVSDPDESKGEAITARTLLDNGAERIERELAAEPALKAELTGLIGNLYVDLGDAARAEPLLRRAAELSADIGDDGALHARTLLDLSLVERKRGDHVRALEDENAALHDADAARDRALTAEVHRAIGETLRAEGEFAKGEAAIRAALDEDRAVHGAASGEVADDLHNLGLVLDDLNRYDEAETAYRQALALQRELHGEQHTGVAAVLSDYGLMLHNKGDLAGAAQLDREALAIHRKIEGEEHPYTLETENNLAAVLDDEGKYDETIVTYRRLLEVRRRVLGAQHPQVAVALNNLARAEHARADYASAETHLREAVAIWTATEGAQNPDTARGWRNLAAVLREAGKYAEAETAARESLAIDRAHYPEVSEQVGASLNSVGKTQRLRGHFVDALATYRQSLDILGKASGEASSFAVVALTGIGETQYDAGDIGNARNTLTRSAQLALRALPEGNYQIADTLLPLGRTEHAAGDDDAAERTLREALALRAKAFKPQDRRMVEVQIALAECLTRVGSNDEALQLSGESIAALAGKSTVIDQALLARAQAVQKAATTAAGKQQAATQRL